MSNTFVLPEVVEIKNWGRVDYTLSLREVPLGDNARKLEVDRGKLIRGRLISYDLVCSCTMGWLARDLGVKEGPLRRHAAGWFEGDTSVSMESRSFWMDLLYKHNNTYRAITALNDASQEGLTRLVPSLVSGEVAVEQIAPIKEALLTRLLRKVGVELSFVGEYVGGDDCISLRPAKEEA